MLIIDRLAWGISEHLVLDEKTKTNHSEILNVSTIVNRIYKSLLEWLMAMASSVLSNPNIALRITEVIEETLHVAVLLN
jgi:hypothetical protein